MPRPTRAARLLSAIAATTVVAALTGACSGGGEQPEPEPSASPSGGAEKGEAPMEVEADGLPADFPREEVPVVEGEVASVKVPRSDNSVYTVLVYPEAETPAAMLAQAVTLLEDAGWTAQTELPAGSTVPQVLVKDGGTASRAILVTEGEGDTAALTYAVSVRS